MLCGYHYRVNTHRLSGLPVILDGELGLGVRPEVRHNLRCLLADVRKYAQGLV